MIMRRVARPLLAAVFVSGGIEALRDPKPHIQAAEPVLDGTVGKLEDKLPDQVPTDAESLVRLDAAVKIGAGLALALGRFPRLAALLLAGTLIPTTAASHRFWECEDPQERAAQRVHFFKNLGLLGGLMITAGDTHGKPSVAWRTKHAANAASGSVQRTTAVATGKAHKLADTASGKVHEAADSVKGAAKGTVKGFQAATGTAKTLLPG